MKTIKSKYNIGYLVNFVNTYSPLAVQCENQFSIPAEAMIAEAALESGWSRFVKHNNFFNIKATPTWTGQTYIINAPEFIAGKWVMQTSTFKAYNTALESFIDYCELITSNQRYAIALDYAKEKDVAEYVKQLALDGYATDPNYAQEIMDIIRWNLVITE